MFALSEESKVSISCRFPHIASPNKERIAKLLDLSRVAIHYGWIPLIVYLGYTQSVPRPSLMKLLTPLPTA